MVFDPLVEERVAPGVVVARSQSGNPMIVPRGEVAPVEYDRASSLADYLVKDIFGIKVWEKRLDAIAFGRNPDLAALAAVEGYNTGLGLVNPLLTPEENRASGKRLDEIIRRAEDRIGMHEKADMGTVAHAATEPGYDGPVHPVIAEAVAAIRELTAALEVVGTEIFVANDQTRSAGTFDHAYYIADQALARELSEVLSEKTTQVVDLTGLLIGDKKTGKNCHVGQFEVQVGGTYAHGDVYLGPPVMETSPASEGGIEYPVDQRLTLEEYFGGPVNRTTGLLVHASTTGTPKPRVLPLDLQRGHRLGLVAGMVRDARNEMDKIGTPKKVDMTFVSEQVLSAKLAEVLDGPTENVRESGLALYAQFKHVWKPAHSTAVKARLEGASS